VFRPPETTQNLLAQARLRSGRNIIIGAPFDVKTKPAEWLLVHAIHPPDEAVASVQAAMEVARRFVNVCKHASIRLATTTASRGAATQVMIQDVRVVLPAEPGARAGAKAINRLGSDAPIRSSLATYAGGAEAEQLPAVLPGSRGATANLPTEFYAEPAADQAFPDEPDQESSSLRIARELGELGAAGSGSGSSRGPLKVFVKLGSRTHANAVVSGFRFLRKRAADARTGAVPQVPVHRASSAGASAVGGGRGGASRGHRQGGSGSVDMGGASSAREDTVMVFSSDHPVEPRPITGALSDVSMVERLDVSFLPSLNKQFAEDKSLVHVPCLSNAHAVTYDKQRDDGILGVVTKASAERATALVRRGPSDGSGAAGISRAASGQRPKRAERSRSQRASAGIGAGSKRPRPTR